jgi:hypothetical protein
VAKYNGNPEGFAKFNMQWTAVDKLMNGFHYPLCKRLTELKKILIGRAKSLVEDLFDIDDNYQIAIDTVIDMGKDAIAHVRKIMTTVQNITVANGTLKDKHRIHQAAMAFINSINGLKLTDTDVLTALLVSHFEKILDPAMRKDWVKYVDKRRNQNTPLGANITFGDMITDIRRHTEQSQRTSAAGGGTGGGYAPKASTTKAVKKPSKKGKQTSAKAVVVVKQTGAQKPTPKAKKAKKVTSVVANVAPKSCVFCRDKYNHKYPLQCRAVKIDLSDDVIKQLASKNNLCHNCLCQHHTQNCDAPDHIHCRVDTCVQRHCKAFHPGGSGPKKQKSAQGKQTPKKFNKNPKSGNNPGKKKPGKKPYKASGKAAVASAQAPAVTPRPAPLTYAEVVAHKQIIEQVRAQNAACYPSLGTGNAHHYNCSASLREGGKILQTAIAWAMAENGQRIKVRVLCDTGSELLLIRRRIAKSLGIKGRECSLEMSLAGGSKSAVTQEEEIPLRLLSLDGTYVSAKLLAVTSKTITTPIAAVPVDPSDFKHLKGLKFTETYPTADKREIDLMVDTSLYCDLLETQGIIRGNMGEPCAIPTKLGPILAGQYLRPTFRNANPCMVKASTLQMPPVSTSQHSNPALTPSYPCYGDSFPYSPSDYV